MIASHAKPYLRVVMYLLIVVVCAQPAAGFSRNRFKAQALFNKEYFVLLINLSPAIFLMTEIVELNFADNGTFSLKSDLFDQPALGTYQRDFLRVRAEGKTVRFIDETLGDMEMSFILSGLPLGFSGFFINGIGTRDFTFYEDNATTVFTSSFIYFGPGF